MYLSIYSNAIKSIFHNIDYLNDRIDKLIHVLKNV